MSSDPSPTPRPSPVVVVLRLVTGVVFAAIGVAFLLESLGYWSWSPDTLAGLLTWIGPALLVAAGVVLLATGARRH